LTKNIINSKHAEVKNVSALINKILKKNKGLYLCYRQNRTNIKPPVLLFLISCTSVGIIDLTFVVQVKGMTIKNHYHTLKSHFYNSHSYKETKSYTLVVEFIVP